MAKVTKRLVESIKPGPQDTFVWDSELRGFGVRVKPSGMRSYLIQYRNRQGRSRRLTIGAHGPLTAQQARGEAQQLLAEVARGGDPVAERVAARSQPTLAEFAEKYMSEHAPGRKKPSTIETDRINLRCHIIPALGRTRVVAITKADVKRLYNSMRDTPGAANRTIQLLSNMMNVAEQDGLRPEGSNPCRGIERFKERKRERFLSEAELARLAEVLAEAERTRIETPKVIAAIRLLLFTGARLSEILTLRWEHVDMEGQCLRLPHSKTGAKVVYLPPAALEILTALDRHEDNPYVIAGAKRGAHLINLQKPWRRIRERAGLDDVRIHDLRHSFASMAVAGGLTLPVIGALLGHTQPATTARYAHLADDPLKQAANLTGARIAAAMKQGVQVRKEDQARK